MTKEPEMKSDLIDVLRAYDPDFFLRQPFLRFAEELTRLAAERDAIQAKQEKLQKQAEEIRQEVKTLIDNLSANLIFAWENCGDG